MADMPKELTEAVEEVLEDISPRAVVRASAALSERYRDKREGRGPVARSRLDASAYAVSRLPATYAAISAVFGAVREQRPEWHPRSMLDLGAGPGTGLWSAAHAWPSLKRCTAVEGAGEMLALGQRLAASASQPAVRSARWVASGVESGEADEAYDLVLLGYVLAELDVAAQTRAVDRAASATDATDGLVAIVEPGTPAGYRRILRARSQLLARGMSVVAPCPHDAPCPLPENDWCHFGVRLPRSSLHRAAKAADLNFEDEKYAYVVMARERGTRTISRVLRHPQTRPRLIQLTLCTPAGARSIVVPKSDLERFRLARKVRWGDSFPDTGSEAARDGAR